MTQKTIDAINDKEIFKELKKEAKHFALFNDFVIYAGWQNWMEELLEKEGYPTNDGEMLDEMQVKIIDECLMEIWEEAHNNDD